MSPARKKERRERALKLIRALKREFPEAKLALRYRTPWQLLVAVQLSAQSTDKKVNQILPEIFGQFRTVRDFADADIRDLEKAVSGVLYYRNKARNIQAAARKITEEYNGRLPKTMEGMLTVPGIARKSANVLLGTLFGVVEGITVDTHVIRFSRRFNLTDYKDAVRIERDLMEIIPKKEWYRFSYLVIEYGRSYGNPRGKRELHAADPLLKLYPKAKNRWP